MSRLYLPLMLLFLVVLQGAAFNFIPLIAIEAGLMLVVHWTFTFLVLFTLFYDLEKTYYSIFFAILFGLMIDIVYTNVIGVYMFTYGLVIYFVHAMRKFLHANFFVAILLTLASISLVDLSIYVIYSFIGISGMEITQYFLYRLIPTVIMNTVFFIVFYLVFKRKLVRWSKERFGSKSSS